eukprot:g785.t1
MVYDPRRYSKRLLPKHIPVLDAASGRELSWREDVQSIYEQSQLLLIKNVGSLLPKIKSFLGKTDLLQLKQEHPSLATIENELGYHSLLVQEKETVKQVLVRLPFEKGIPPFLVDPGIAHKNHVWLFFAKNSNRNTLKGRPEHCDEINDSTFHFQMSGKKIWNLRPNGSAWKEVPSELNSSFKVIVEAGDVLLINTKLWFHHTEIPNTYFAKDQMSFSYARDFNINGLENCGGETSEFSNQDGLFATRPFQEGEIVLLQSDVPENLCLPQSPNPNCEVVYATIFNGEEEREEGALLAIKKIEKGEWFTIATDE